MKSESLVIANKNVAVNLSLNSVHTARHMPEGYFVLNKNEGVRILEYMKYFRIFEILLSSKRS